jgi:hypothetical protein
MSLADARIVRMAEIYERHAVLTLDSDFSVYRKHGRIPARAHSPSGGARSTLTRLIRLVSNRQPTRRMLLD